MPFVNVKVAGTLSGTQRAQIVAGITQVLQDVAGKPPEATYIVIDEVPRDQWAKGGVLLAPPEN